MMEKNPQPSPNEEVPKMIGGRPIETSPDKDCLIEHSENQIKNLKLNLMMAEGQLSAIRKYFK